MRVPPLSDSDARMTQHIPVPRSPLREAVSCSHLRLPEHGELKPPEPVMCLRRPGESLLVTTLLEGHS